MSSANNKPPSSSNGPASILIDDRSSQQPQRKSSPKNNNSSSGAEQDRQKESPHELVPSPGVQSNLMRRQPSPTESSQFYNSSSSGQVNNTTSSLPDKQAPAKATADDDEVPPVLELESKKRIIKNDIQRVLSKYDEIKHRLFVNKERLIDNELSQLEQGTHPQLKRDLDELEQHKERRLKVAKLKLDLFTRSMELDLANSQRNAERMVHEGKKEIRRHLIKQCQQQLVQLTREQQDIASGAELHLSHIELPLLYHTATAPTNLRFPQSVDSLKHHEISQDILALSSR